MGCKNSTLKGASDGRGRSGSTTSVSGSAQPVKSNSAAKYMSASTSTCHFCNKQIPQKDYKAHTIHCDERIVTCGNNWCRERVRQGELDSHMELCVKRQTAICGKCGKQVLAMNLQEHYDVCTPLQCPYCPEKCIYRILKYCPVSLLAKTPLTTGPFCGEQVRAKFLSDKPNDPSAIQNANVAKIQHLWRWVKTKALLEDIIFRLIHKEMDLKKEGFAIFKAHDADRETSRKSRSILQQPQIPSNENHYFPTKATQPITVDHILRMIRDVCNNTLLPYSAAWRVFTDAMNLLGSLPNVTRLTPPAGARLVKGRWYQGGKTVVVGDLHGQLADLLHIIRECGMPSESTYYVFNGDFVDRGAQGVEVLLVLFTLLVAFPKYVALNRGNHECDYMNEEYGFDVEVSTKYDRNMFRLIQRCFCALPLATLIGTKVFVVHGGIPRRPGVTIAEISKLQRFRQIPMPENAQPEEDEMYQDMLWSDPFDALGWQESDRGAGVQFGADVTLSFLENNELDLVIRSHEEYIKGYEEHHGGKLVTVFSASNYNGVDTNNGAFIVLAGDIAEPSFHTFQVYDDEYSGFDEGGESAGRGNNLSETQILGSALLSSALKPHNSNGISSFPLAAMKLQSSKRRNTKDEVLRLVRERIYLRRHRLMAYFTKLDRTRKGSVWKIEWVETMRNVLNLDLPWYFLRRYVADEEDESATRIYYSQFLSRYHNQFMTLWLHSWESDMVKGITSRQKNTMDVLRRLFTKDVSNYNEFCTAMRSVDHALTDAALFQLFQYFDASGCGFINTDHVLQEVENASLKTWSALRWDMDALEQLQNIIIQGRVQLPGIFKVTTKEPYLTKEQFLGGMVHLARGLRKNVSPSQREAIWKFMLDLAQRTEGALLTSSDSQQAICFSHFLRMFSVFHHEDLTLEPPQNGAR